LKSSTVAVDCRQQSLSNGVFAMRKFLRYGAEAAVVVFFVVLGLNMVNAGVLVFLGIVLAVGLVYLLWARDYSRRPHPYDLFTGSEKEEVAKHSAEIPEWRTTDARVVSVESETGGSIDSGVATSNVPDMVIVKFAYKVGGREYENEFAVISDPDDRWFQEIAARAAGKEVVRIQYDPQQPEHCVLFTGTWHGSIARSVLGPSQLKEASHGP
jgi:hypothetical protein